MTDTSITNLVERCVRALEEGDDDVVERVCAEHPEHAAALRQRLGGLVRAGLLKSDDLLDDNVHGYDIREPLGQGGMGSVFLAEQRAPVRRDVALKVVKLGMDSRQVVRRFEAERQALALMSHPGIAIVFDAGTTERGRPFFAMEYVPGQPITRFCDERKVATEARLQLFVDVCEAVQYAHGQGVVHRDLKPSNVLVFERDGRFHPKIIDFGVAKATGANLDVTLQTDEGQMIGTPEYMSPEQARADGSPIDERTDVYALGVVLYELLAGSLPIPSSELREAGAARIPVLIENQEPPTPSTRVSTVGDSDDVAKARATQPGALSRTLRGDLDNIVLKALEKEPSRRYAMPEDLAADLERYLRAEPVLARAPSAWYRLSKLARRRRAALVVAAVVLAVVFAGLYGTFSGFGRAAESEAETAREASKAYRASIVAAQSALDLHRVADARRHLEACPPELRQWEWEILWSRLDESEAILGPLDPPSPVTTVVGNAAGTRVATGHEDGSVAVWDVETGALTMSLRDLSVHPEVRNATTCLGFAGGGLWIGRAGGHVEWWDTARDESVTIGAHGGAVTDLAVLPGGDRVVTAGRDAAARVWSRSSGSSVVFSQHGAEQSHGAEVMSVDVSADGSRIVSYGTDRTVRVWNASDAAEVAAKTIDSINGGDRGRVRWSTEDQCLLATGAGMTVLSVPSLEITAQIEGELQGEFSVSSDRRHVAATARDGSLWIWDVETRERTHVLHGHETAVSSLGACGPRFVTGGGSGRARLWNPWSDDVGDVIRTPRHGTMILACSPDGAQLALAGSRGLLIVDVATGDLIARLQIDVCEDAEFSPDGSLLAATRDNTVRLWETADWSPRGVIARHVPNAYNAAFDPATQRLATGAHDGPVRLWDLASGEMLDELEMPREGAWHVFFHEDGRRLVACTGAGRVRVWDLESRRVVADHVAHERAIHAAAFSPDGTWFATASQDGTCAVWDPETWSVVHELDHGEFLTSLAFDVRSMRVLTGDRSGGWKIWDLLDGSLTLSLETGTKLMDVLLDPGGAWLAAAGSDQLVLRDVVPARRERRRLALAESRIVADLGPLLNKSKDADESVEQLSKARVLSDLELRAARNYALNRVSRPLNPVGFSLVDPQWRVVADEHQDLTGGAYLLDGAYIGVGFDTSLRRYAGGAWQTLSCRVPGNGLTVDPVSGDLFSTDLIGGRMYRVRAADLTGADEFGAELWVNAVAPGKDSDPVGLAVAPPDYHGPVLAPGDGLVCDWGKNSRPGVYRWSTREKGAIEPLFVGEPGWHRFMCVAISSDRVVIGDLARSTLLALAADGSFADLPSSEPLHGACSLAFDPRTGDLYIALREERGCRVVRRDRGGAIHEVIVGLQVLMNAPALSFTPDGGKLVVVDHWGMRFRELERVR